MAKRKKPRTPETAENLRLNPETRIAPIFDSTSIAKFPVAKPGEMGFRVLDDCTQEHLQ